MIILVIIIVLIRIICIIKNTTFSVMFTRQCHPRPTAGPRHFHKCI